MSSIYDISGTSHHSFQIGDGPTIYYGNIEPTNDIGKIGDIYIFNKTTTNENELSSANMYLKSSSNNVAVWFKVSLV